jgi:Mlc titration factor MtfA (ptsG expression regulator)
MEIAALVLFVCFIAWLSYNWRRTKPALAPAFPEVIHRILEEKVNFYRLLPENEQPVFEERVQQFLSQVKITGVNCKVEEEDLVFVAASAIIPVMGFPGWQYNNLNEVLLYPGSFNEDFSMQEAAEKSVLGMVGDGPLQHMMVLSQHSLRQGFMNVTDKHNTGIHEFVHLLDKTDGAVDGIPENLLSRQHLVPWVKRMHEGIRQIMAERSDINPYGATNEAEFFAVAAEYFFERPDLLQSNHPLLYEMLRDIFRQHLKSDTGNTHDAATS